MNLEIEVVSTAGQFHGEEWPPAPARLFQALVAATHRGAHGLFHSEVRDQALRWLESLPPPEILAPRAVSNRQRLTNYVPNNDDQFVEHIRTGKSMAAYCLPVGQSVAYRWNFTAADSARRHAEVVVAMSALVTCFGRTVDLVYARGRIQDEAGVVPAGVVLHRPCVKAGGRWLAPASGFLALCQQRYPRSVSEQSQDFTNSVQVDYATEPVTGPAEPIAVFEMQRSDRRLLAFDPRDVRQPAGMVRHALQAWVDANPAMPAHYGPERIARLLFGHRSAASAEPSDGGHFAVVPLPSLNAAFTADGWFRRVALVGHGLQDANDHELLEDATRGLSGTPLADRGRRIGRLREVPAQERERLLALWRGSPAGHRVWRSITPIVLTGFSRRGRTPEQCLMRALHQQGFDAQDVVSVAAFRGPVVPRALPALQYRLQGYLATTPRVHAEVVFGKPVHGPLVIGRGRFVGLGLMVPWDGA